MHVKNDNDYDSYYEDTMRAGHYENNPEAVDIMIRSSQDTIRELIGYGVDFKHNETAVLHLQEKVHIQHLEFFFMKI